MKKMPKSAKKQQTNNNPLERDSKFNLTQPYLNEVAKQSEFTHFEQPSFLTHGRKEFTIFRHIDYVEDEQIPQRIEYLSEQIQATTESIKSSNKQLMQEVVNIEKTILEARPSQSGIYHVRFLETLLSYLQTLGAKVKEARTWMTALTSKKAKRGSLFAARTKKKGTQYSMSQELQNARGVM